MECRAFNPDLTVISEKTKVIKYNQKEQDDIKDDRGIKLKGQKKLLLVETRFLTDSLKPEMEEIIVIFAGAVTGEHYILLAEMFPYIKEFHLWDPKINNTEGGILDKRVKDEAKKNNSRFKLFSQIIDIENAKAEYGEKYNNSTLILISDIRTQDYYSQANEETQKIIIKDNQTQKDLVETIKPAFALLKMKFPYPDIYYTMNKTVDYEYFDGIIYTQTMNLITSFEMRLVVTREYDFKYKTKTYDLDLINNKITSNMMDVRRYWISKEKNIKNEWKNSINSMCQYPKNIDLRSDFDSAYVMYILQRYIKKYTKGIKSNIPDTMFAKVLALWKYIFVDLTNKK